MTEMNITTAATVTAKVTSVKNCKNYLVNKRIEKHASCQTTFAGRYIFQAWEEKGRFYAAYTSFNSGKDFQCYYFRNEAGRNEYVTRVTANVTHSQAQKAERKAGAKGRKQEAVAALEVGSILYTSWGYDQTNVEFYQVVSIKGQLVKVKEVYRNYNEEGFMSGTCTPRKDDFMNAPELTLGLTQGGGYQIDGHYANIHQTGKTHYTSSYA